MKIPSGVNVIIIENNGKQWKLVDGRWKEMANPLLPYGGISHSKGDTQALLGISDGEGENTDGGWRVYVKGKLGIQKTRIKEGAIVKEEGSIRIEDQKAKKVLENMIEGVTTGYKERIRIKGVGYKAEKIISTLGQNKEIGAKGESGRIELSLGYKDVKKVPLNPQVKIEISGNNTVIEGKGTLWTELRQYMSKLVEQRPAYKDRYKGKGVEKWKK